MEEFFGFIIDLVILFLFCYILYVFYRFYKGIDTLLKLCTSSKRCFEYHKENAADFEDYFTLIGRLAQNEIIYNSIKQNFKFLYSKKGWLYYENYWNSRS